MVEGADKVEVSLYGEEDDLRYRARVVGRDPLTDSALIELTEKPDHALPEAKFGDSAQMQPGDWVMAIGNPFGLSHTVSVGVVSALKRPFPVSEGRTIDMLQTDAAINPGNSGGPLLNVRGEVVGMNTAIYADSRQSGNIGIGFAVPINVVRSLLPQLRTGKITRGMIGVSGAARAARGARGVRVEGTHGSGRRRGDAQGARRQRRRGAGRRDPRGQQSARSRSRDELVQTVMALTPGTTVPVTVLRDKQRKTLNVTIGEINLDQEAGQRADADSRGGGHRRPASACRSAASPPNAPVVLACPRAPTAPW